LSWRRKAYIGFVILVVLIFAFLVRSMNPSRFWHSLGGIRWPWLVAVFFANLLNTWIEASRWRLMLGSVKRNVRSSSTFSAMLVGVVGNAVLPLRLGDGARAYFLARREKVPVASSLATVMLDRMMDATFFLLLVLITGLYFHFPVAVERGGILGSIALGGAVLGLVILAKYGPREQMKFRSKLSVMLVEQARRFKEGLSCLKSAGVLLPAGALSTFSWLLRMSMVLAVFKAFHFDLPFIAAAVALIFSNIGIAAVSTPANVGGFELSMLAALSLFGIEKDAGLGCALVFHVVEVLPMVILGLVVLWLSGVRSSNLLRQLESPPENGG